MGIAVLSGIFILICAILAGIDSFLKGKPDVGIGCFIVAALILLFIFSLTKNED